MKMIILVLFNKLSWQLLGVVKFIPLPGQPQNTASAHDGGQSWETENNAVVSSPVLDWIICLCRIWDVCPSWGGRGCSQVRNVLPSLFSRKRMTEYGPEWSRTEFKIYSTLKLKLGAGNGFALFEMPWAERNGAAREIPEGLEGRRGKSSYGLMEHRSGKEHPVAVNAGFTPIPYLGFMIFDFLMSHMESLRLTL